MYITDITATCIDAAGATYPTEFEGRQITPIEGESFMSVIQGERWTRQQPIFWEHEGQPRGARRRMETRRGAR